MFVFSLRKAVYTSNFDILCIASERIVMQQKIVSSSLPRIRVNYFWLAVFVCRLANIITTSQLDVMFTGKGNGSRAAEDSVTAEERQKGGGEEKVTGSRSENGCQSSTRPHMSCLQGESIHLY